MCGGAWGNDKMVWGLREVVGRRCSALLVLGLGIGEVRWWGGAVAHYWCLAWEGRRGRCEGKSAVAHYWCKDWEKG